MSYDSKCQRFFRKVLFRTAEIPNPTVQIDPSAFDVNEEQTGLMIRKVYELSKIVHDEEADESNSIFLCVPLVFIPIFHSSNILQIDLSRVWAQQAVTG